MIKTLKNIMIKNKVVGIVVNDCFFKKVNGSKHFLRTPPAIAFDKSTITTAIKYGAKSIRVLDKDTEIVYEADMDYFNEFNFSINRGFGHQVALMLDNWTIDKPKYPKIKLDYAR